MQLTVDQRVSTEDSQVLVIAPAGEVDLATAGQLREGLEQAEAQAPGGLVIDLRAVGFIDSTGIGELVGCHRRCRESDRPLAFVVPEGPISKILRVPGLDSVFVVYGDEPAAVKAVATGS